jgi:7-cyano-7-deazaguanine reductase
MSDELNLDKLEKSELGKKAAYNPNYNPDALFPIARKSKRLEIGIKGKLPFIGFDLWNHYEVSWLNEKGRPNVAIAEITYPCESPNIIESKSMKLYFNSFNNTKISSLEKLTTIITQDLSENVGAPVLVTITELNSTKDCNLYSRMDGLCLDNLDIECSIYTVNRDYLTTEPNITEETIYSNLLKSNCLVTNQPDWASIQIKYKGPQINHEGLLKYLISFRNHNEFHEQCIERIFIDIMHMCKPEELAIYGRYTRRGGLDINAYRGTSHMHKISNDRLIRQ